MRALVYFADAESSPLPDGLSEADWGAIKADFETKVRTLALP